MRPTLIVVSGPPASGKTTLAHAVARAVPCPAICRDEIREGIAKGAGEEPPRLGDPATQLVTSVFFDVVELLVRRGVTLVAEAAFQHRLWAPKLIPLRESAELRVIRCTVDAAIARERLVLRKQTDPNRQRLHADADLIDRIDRGEVRLDEHDPIDLDVPTLVVDTTDGYSPAFEAITSFTRS